MFSRFVSQLNIVYPDKEIDLTNDQEVNDEHLKDDLFDDQTVLELKNGIKIKRRSNAKIIRDVRFNRKSDEENYFREKLLLCYPWRNEESDLLGKFDTYIQHYDNF